MLCLLRTDTCVFGPSLYLKNVVGSWYMFFLGRCFLCHTFSLTKQCHHCFFHPLNSRVFAVSCLRPCDWATGWNLGCRRYSKKEVLQWGIFSHVPCPWRVVKEVWKSCLLPFFSPSQGVAIDFLAHSQDLTWQSSQPDVLLLRLSVVCWCRCVLLGWEGSLEVLEWLPVAACNICTVAEPAAGPWESGLPAQLFFLFSVISFTSPGDCLYSWSMQKLEILGHLFRPVICGLVVWDMGEHCVGKL